MMYDYILVGAGSAGCVLANRLTENFETSVLLLEAGSNDDLPAIHDATAAPTLLHTAVDWAYFTEEEPHLNHRKIYQPRGKVLGGSSSTNFLTYVRGNRHDYDDWQELGNKGWSYADVLPYFKKAENWESGTSDYRGVGGPINVTDPSSINPLTEAFIEAGIELGWSRNTDYNGASQEGFGFHQSTVCHGKRSSTADGYLHPAESRPNLTVWTNTLVTRVLFEGTRAVGIAYLKDGKEQQVRVKKEVILSGGAFNSPQTLLLSGVGSGDQLQALHIRVVADIPGVGRNLQDHPGFDMFFATKPSFTPYGNEPGGIAFMKTQPDLPDSDLQLLFRPCFLFPTVPGKGYTIVVLPTRPQSRGHVTLRSTDPTQPPAIFANYLEHEADQQTFVTGMKLVRRLAQTASFARYTDAETLPGLQVQSDTQIIEFLREHVRTISHPVGTCKMGHDEMAVVDEQLRVRGVDGLRVVDASIMPIIPHGNTNAPTIMIAEKAADMIAHNVQ